MADKEDWDGAFDYALTPSLELAKTVWIKSPD